MFERIERSWNLVKASAAVLRADKELLVFPLVSSIALIVVCVGFILPFIATGGPASLQAQHAMPPAYYVALFAFYVVQYLVIFFFNAALVGAAMIRLDGGDPTVSDGLRIASSKIVPILGYALIAATVGMVLRAIEERAGFIGRIVVGLIGIAWSLVTFLTVPVLVAQDVGPFEAIRRSGELLKRTWGENLLGNGGIGIVFGWLVVAVMLVGVALTVGSASIGANPLAFVFGAATVIAVMFLMLVQAALAGIYSAALYRYANDGKAPAGFDAMALQQAFRVKA